MDQVIDVYDEEITDKLPDSQIVSYQCPKRARAANIEQYFNTKLLSAGRLDQHQMSYQRSTARAVNLEQNFIPNKMSEGRPDLH